MASEIKEVREIPLDQIIIGTSQARTRNVDRGIEELARSIERIGLLEPIVVQEVEGGQYEVITGQRRFLAHQYLKKPTIRAAILKEHVEPHMAKAISLTENMMREDMPSKDYIDACTELFRRYGSIKAVSDELGLPPNKVSQYVKFDQLIEGLKNMYLNEQLKMDVALRAQKAEEPPRGGPP